MIFATAFEPYQELFQGVVVCLHADFRLGDSSPAKPNGAGQDLPPAERRARTPEAV